MTSFLLSGCTGIITGHEYKKEDLIIVYKVVKNGVTTFMTPEEIKREQERIAKEPKPEPEGGFQ